MNSYIVIEEYSLNNIYKKPFCTIRNGAMNTLERLNLENLDKPDYLVYTNQLNNLYVKYIFDKLDKEIKDNNVRNIVFDEMDFSPWALLSTLNRNIENDFNLLLKNSLFTPITKILKDIVIGEKDKIIVKDNNSIKIFQGVILDTTKGEIIIDENVEIYPFSTLEGPLYIGKNTVIKAARISGGVIIGNNCKISGEIFNSIIGDFSNKSHESALLNSYVGNWCNIAGYTNTTNLKYNYSNVIVKYNLKKIDTGTIKFGSIINDFSRLSSGMTIMPGTFIDSCSTIIEDSVVKGYYKPFSFLNKISKQNFKEFVFEIDLIMQRRNKSVSDILEKYFEKLYKLH